MMSANKIQQTGLTLVEVLVALALSSILATALYQIVISNQQSMRVTESYSRALEAPRTAYDLMGYDLRMAGYQGCVNDAVTINNQLNASSADYNPFLHDFSEPVEAINDYDPSSGLTFGGVQPVAGTDVFISRNAVTTDMYLGQQAAAASTILRLAGPQNQIDLLKEGQVMIISDCQKGHVFATSDVNTGNSQIQHGVSVPDGPDNLSAQFGEDYAAGSQVLLMNTVVYFVAESNLMSDLSVNSLYRFSMNDNPDDALELVPFIGDMQLIYGVDSNADGNPDSYMDAQDIINNSINMSTSVYSISVNLSVVTDNPDLQPKQFERTFFVRNAGDR